MGDTLTDDLIDDAWVPGDGKVLTIKKIYVEGTEEYEDVFYAGDKVHLLPQDTMVVIEFEENKMWVFEAYRDCCEHLYVETADDVDDLIGQRLVKVELLYGPEEDQDGWGVKETAFLHIHTDKDSIVVNHYNEHNGYYGGTSMTKYEYGTSALDHRDESIREKEIRRLQNELDEEKRKEKLKKDLAKLRRLKEEAQALSNKPWETLSFREKRMLGAYCDIYPERFKVPGTDAISSYDDRRDYPMAALHEGTLLTLEDLLEHMAKMGAQAPSEDNASQAPDKKE